jgi:hypothetical protein
MRNIAINAVAMQFVNFTEIMSKPIPTSRKEADFALSALMEIPAQFKAAMHLQLLGYFTCLAKTTFVYAKLDTWSFPVVVISIVLYSLFLGQQTKRIFE